MAHPLQYKGTEDIQFYRRFIRDFYRWVIRDYSILAAPNSSPTGKIQNVL